MNSNITVTLQIWLTWIFSKALGICGAGLATIGITTSHDTPQLMAGVALTALQMVLSWWNTRRALQVTPSAPATIASVPLHVVLAVVAIPALGLTACSTTASPAGASGSTSTSISFIETQLPVIRVGASVATGAVLDFAVTNAEERTKLANEMYSAANAVYSLSGGTFPTAAQFQSTILAFGGTQADATYTQFATAIAALYAAYYPKIATGDAKTAIDLLNALAGGIEDATQAYVTTPTVLAKTS